MIIKTRINVKPSFAGRPKFPFPAGRRQSGATRFRCWTSEMLDRILAKGPITVLKKPLKTEQLQQTVKILGHKDAIKLAA